MMKITFGRSQDNDIIYDNKAVSRHHGYLLIDGSKVSIVDDNSLNGIYVNGRRINEKATLSYGDKVLVANLYNLEWTNYCRVDAEKTVLNNREIPKQNEAPKKEKKSFFQSSFAKTAGNILKYIITTVITLAVMTLITKWLR